MSNCSSQNGCTSGGVPDPKVPPPKDFRPTTPSIFTREHPFQKEAFLDATLKRFRTCVMNTPYCNTKRNEKFLVGYSGGINSSAILHMLYLVINESPYFNNKTPFDVHVLFVDTGAAVNLTDEERKKNIMEAESIVKGYNFAFHHCKLEDLFKEDKSPEKQLQDYLSSFKTLTAKEDAFKLLLKKRLVSFAHENEFTKVMTAETATHFAIQVIADIAKGRGYTLRKSINFIDDAYVQDFNVKILHPFKLMLAKEMAFYCHYQKVKTIFIPHLSTMAHPKSSIDLLTEEFIVGLQDSYPSTVHAILRTIEKLKEPDTKDAIHCVFCENALSKEDEEQLMNEVNKEGEMNELMNENIKLFCCYACKRIISEKRELKNFPVYVNDNALRNVKMTRKQMKEEIKEFLIE